MSSHSPTSLFTVTYTWGRMWRRTRSLRVLRLTIISFMLLFPCFAFHVPCDHPPCQRSWPYHFVALLRRPSYFCLLNFCLVTYLRCALVRRLPSCRGREEKNTKVETVGIGWVDCARSTLSLSAQYRTCSVCTCLWSPIMPVRHAKDEPDTVCVNAPKFLIRITAPQTLLLPSAHLCRKSAFAASLCLVSHLLNSSPRQYSPRTASNNGEVAGKKQCGKGTVLSTSWLPRGRPASPQRQRALPLRTTAFVRRVPLL